MNIKAKTVSLALTLLTIVSLVGCSSTEKLDLSTPDGLYASAEQLDKDERYEEAISRYSEVKNKHPYSKYAAQAELKIADVHFKREAYIESQGSYQIFKEFHPKHPQADYVTFRLGLSYFNQLPSSIDRDLGVAEKAVIYFDEVITTFPTSSFVEEAKKKKGEALKMAAEKELYVARFYFKQKKYDSALKRYEFLLKNHAGRGLDPEALLGAAISANKTGERDRSQKHLTALISNFPQSDEAKRAKNELGETK
jgi:outer membrane protein assembly factor BamD